ncbi:MAG: class I SAM-dependent methyltransferase [Planctomycetes bacterium]|nr:class I SAM-dependent methyltransferase [Planctomycetota bacterium]
MSLHLRYCLLRQKIDRNQWELQPESALRHRKWMTLSWEETASGHPDYFARLSASVAHVRGRVLELGCGMGNMTRWIAARDEVSEVVAVDGFEQALAELRQRALPKVDARCMGMHELHFEAGERFDTVVACELLEHLYPDEEAALLAAIRPHLAQGAGYVVSVPIGWLEDPHHVRAFSRAKLTRHLARHFGPAEGRDESSGYSQVAWGRFTQRGV